MANPGSYGSSGGSFPGASPAIASSTSTGAQNAGFFAQYNISSTDQALYLMNGHLNQNAAELNSYYQMGQAQRQQLEQLLVDAGLLKQTDVTGIVGTASISAFKTAIGQASQSGLSVSNYLNQASQGGIGPLQTQVSGQITAAQNALSRQTPITASLENPSTLAAAINQAFVQTLGYAPNQAQTDAFIKDIQAQDVNYAQGAVETNKAQAQTDLNQAQSSESALNKLGAGGIDSFISAYAAAVHGTGVAGAGTAQGPATGSGSVTTNAEYTTPGTPLTPGTFEGFNPNGVEMQGNTLPTTKTVTTHGTRGANPFLGRALTPGYGDPTTTATIKDVPTPGQSVAPSLPTPDNTTQLYGGLYALTPKLWQEAQALTPSAKKYATAGQAPQSVQQAAFTNLTSEFYAKAGNWSDVAIELAGGTPGKPGTVLGKSNIQTFAQGVANDVNNQIASVQAQINSSGPQVTTKVTAPDAAAEANLAAKQADPAGYLAANYSSWGSELGKMLFGRPQDMIQSTADTFTGPVTSPASAVPATTGVAA